MIVIEDFEMPKNCEDCMLCSCKSLDSFYCDITCQYIDIESDVRDADCPLVEIKEREVIEDADSKNN